MDSGIIIADSARGIDVLLNGIFKHYADNAVLCHDWKAVKSKMAGEGISIIFCDVALWSHSRSNYDIVSDACLKKIPIVILFDDFTRHLVGDAVLAGATAVISKTANLNRLFDIPAAPVFEEEEVPEMNLKSYLRNCEKHYIQQILENCGGDKEKATNVLGISLATFYRKYDEE